MWHCLRFHDVFPISQEKDTRSKTKRETGGIRKPGSLVYPHHFPFPLLLLLPHTETGLACRLEQLSRWRHVSKSCPTTLRRTLDGVTPPSRIASTTLSTCASALHYHPTPPAPSFNFHGRGRQIEGVDWH